MLSTNHPSTPHLTHVKHTKYDIKGVVWFHFCIVFYDFVVRKHYRNNFHIKSVCSVYSIFISIYTIQYIQFTCGLRVCIYASYLCQQQQIIVKIYFYLFHCFVGENIITTLSVILNDGPSPLQSRYEF